MTGRQLLQTGLLPRAPLVVPRMAFAATRAISTTNSCLAPREAHPKPTWTSRTKPSEATGAAPSVPATPSSTSRFSPSTAASRSAANDHVYDATSNETFDLAGILAEEASDFVKKHYGREKIELRTKPVLGRTIHVDERTDLATALSRVGALCSRNKIRLAYHRQKIHERPGLKRKRLRMERWRTKFKIGFVATVKRVQELSNQGW